MPRSTIQQVADQAGVSAGTVSNYFNHPDIVRPATRERIAQAVAEVGFVPNSHARRLAGMDTATIGLVLTGLDHAFSLQIAHGAEDAARRLGFEMLIASADNDDVLADHFLEYFLGARMAGVLIEPRAQAGWKMASSAGIPCVVMDVHGDPDDGCYVAVDNQAEGRLAAQHAIDLAAERPMIVTSDEPLQPLVDRRTAFTTALQEHGTAVRTGLVSSYRARAEACELAKAISGQQPSDRPDFILATTDVLAAGLIDGFASSGLPVPQDVAVMGCDGNPVAWDCPITMTTITPHGYELGSRAAELLIGEIKAKDREHSHVLELISPELTKRESTLGPQRVIRSS